MIGPEADEITQKAYDHQEVNLCALGWAFMLDMNTMQNPASDRLTKHITLRTIWHGMSR